MSEGAGGEGGSEREVKAREEEEQLGDRDSRRNRWQRKGCFENFYLSFFSCVSDPPFQAAGRTLDRSSSVSEALELVSDIVKKLIFGFLSLCFFFFFASVGSFLVSE